MSSFLNVIVALTNVVACLPLRLLWHQRDYVTWGCLAFLATFSFASHLCESHKHGMKGFDVPRHVSYLLNRFDVLGCVLLGLRSSYLWMAEYWPNPRRHQLYMAAWALTCLWVSEYDKYNPKRRTLYVVCHSIWHVLAYLLLGHYLWTFGHVANGNT
jgi:VanZ family protein